MQKGCLTGNQLKILALVAMTCDHVGKFLFPHVVWLQLFGRIAYPIFAYMIAEGCTYTKDRKSYLGLLALSAAVCQAVYLFVMHSLYQCIMVTFMLSVSLIFALDYAKAQKKTKGFFVAVGAALGVYVLTEVMPEVVPGFYIDYSFWGVMLPVFVYCVQGKWNKLGMAAIGLILLAADSNRLQWYALFAVPILALYNGERGKTRMKYLFYVYYPVHLAVVYLLGQWL